MGLRTWAERKTMSKLLPYLVKALAEGRFGEAPKKAYWFLAGKKMYIGAVLGAVAALLQWGTSSGTCGQLGLDCTGYTATLASVAGILALIGLYDGAVRAEAPNKFAGLVVLLCLSFGVLSGCAGMLPPISANIGRQPVQQPDQETINGLICRGKFEAAEVYAQDRGASRAEVTERVQRAIQEAFKRPDCCLENACLDKPTSAAPADSQTRSAVR